MVMAQDAFHTFSRASTILVAQQIRFFMRGSEIVYLTDPKIYHAKFDLDPRTFSNGRISETKKLPQLRRANG